MKTHCLSTSCLTVFLFYCCFLLIGILWNVILLFCISGINSCSPPDPPENSFIEGGKRPTEIGSVVKFRCKEGFQFVDKSTKLVTATCECSGRWVYKPMEPRCESMYSTQLSSSTIDDLCFFIQGKMCGEPPLAPMPGGVRSISVSMPPYERGTTVNYSCPEGSGLDGIPYRKCNILGLWEPSTKHHKCIRTRQLTLSVSVLNCCTFVQQTNTPARTLVRLKMGEDGYFLFLTVIWPASDASKDIVQREASIVLAMQAIPKTRSGAEYPLFV